LEINEYLTTRYEYHLNYYRRISYFNKKLYLVTSWIIIVFSVVLPVLIALQQVIPNYFSIILSLILSICFSIQKFLKPGDKWNNSRDILEKLKREKILFEYGIDEYSDLNKNEIFVKNIENIVDIEFKAWRQMQKEISQTVESLNHNEN